MKTLSFILLMAFGATATAQTIELKESVKNKNLPAKFFRALDGKEDKSGFLETTEYTYWLNEKARPSEIKFFSTLIKGGDFKTPTDSFRIAVLDANNNGKYDDAAADKILIGFYKQDSMYTHESVFTGNMSLPFYFKTGNVSYKVTQVSADGQTLSVVVDTENHSPQAQLINPLVNQTTQADLQRELYQIWSASGVNFLEVQNP